MQPVSSGPRAAGLRNISAWWARSTSSPRRWARPWAALPAGSSRGSAAVCDYLTQRARPQLFSNALPPTVAASALASIEYLEQHPERVTTLRDNAAYFRERLLDLGFKPLPGETPIIPVILGETAQAIEMSELLLDEGVFVTGFGFPGGSPRPGPNPMPDLRRPYPRRPGPGPRRHGQNRPPAKSDLARSCQFRYIFGFARLSPHPLTSSSLVVLPAKT